MLGGLTGPAGGLVSFPARCTLTVAGTPSIYAGDEQAFRGVKYERADGDAEIRPACWPAPTTTVRPATGWRRTAGPSSSCSLGRSAVPAVRADDGDRPARVVHAVGADRPEQRVGESAVP